MTILTPTSGGFARPALLAVLLALAATALTGALAAAGAQAEPHPDHRPTYRVTADLDGRWKPAKDFIAIVDHVKAGQEVRVVCQAIGGRAYGSRIWDLVPSDGETAFVPDRFVRTGTNGRSPEIRRCTRKDLRSVTVR
jgi:hypothetical protein